MKMKNYILIGIVLIVILVGGYVLFQIQTKNITEGEMDLPCVKEGQKGNYFEGEKCCSGLTAASNAFYNRETGFCMTATDGSFVCTNCGDDVCGEAENLCNCPNDCKKCNVAVIVDEETYSGISDELSIYKTDVENDTNVNLCIFHDNWRGPDQVKNKISELYEKNGLLGSVLVGDIPAHFSQFGADTIISDHYYMELKSDKLLREVWVGRLTPPIKGVEGIQLLKDYFKRNHQYRSGENTFPKRTLYFNAYDLETKNESEYIKTMIERNKELYNEDEIDYIYSHNRDELKDWYLTKLAKPYEFVYLGTHGSPTSQSIRIENKASHISFDEIKESKPNALFSKLSSCFNGVFTKENYIAGWYLFAGNALVVEAYTAAGFASSDDEYKDIRPLRLGVSFGERQLNSPQGVSVILLGDPTLTLREKPTGPRPRIEPSLLDVDLGKIQIGESIEKDILIYNKGDSELRFGGTGASAHSWPADSSLSESPIYMPISFAFPPVINSGGMGKISFDFSPDVVGEYWSVLTLYTNDPDTPYFRVSAFGKGVKEVFVCPPGCTCVGNTVTCPKETKPIEFEVSTKTGIGIISIEKVSESAISIKTEKASAITSKKLTVKGSKLYLETSVGDKQINVLPEEASSRATEITNVKEIELKEESQKPIYSVRGTKDAKILFLIPVTLEIETKVSAETGEVISVNKPWWSFLAW